MPAARPRDMSGGKTLVCSATCATRSSPIPSSRASGGQITGTSDDSTFRIVGVIRTQPLHGGSAPAPPAKPVGSPPPSARKLAVGAGRSYEHLQCRRERAVVALEVVVHDRARGVAVGAVERVE